LGIPFFIGIKNGFWEGREVFDLGIFGMNRLEVLNFYGSWEFGLGRVFDNRYLSFFLSNKHIDLCSIFMAFVGY
jgi:hypothetical protein